jgi:hypothetical protein
MNTRLPIRRRWFLLTAAGALGAVGFVPSLLANAPEAGAADLLLFVGVVTALDAVCTFFGLRWADGAGLPMPWLRAFETGASPRASPRAAATATLAVALLAGVGSVVLLRIFDLPNLGGPLPARLATTGFAAVSLELVVHLAVMSGVARLTRSVVAGIAAATVVFVLFHGAGALGLEWPIALSATVVNGGFAVALGWIYGRYGFEWVVAGHAIGHAIAVTFA